MRQLTDVLDTIIGEVPDGQLKAELEKLRWSASFTAPEDMRRRWERGQDILFAAMPPDPATLSDKERRILEIWAGRAS